MKKISERAAEIALEEAIRAEVASGRAKDETAARALNWYLSTDFREGARAEHEAWDLFGARTADEALRKKVFRDGINQGAAYHVEVVHLLQALDELQAVARAGSAFTTVGAAVEALKSGKVREATVDPNTNDFPWLDSAGGDGESLPRVDKFMSDEDLTAAAVLIQQSVDWSKLPKLAAIFEHRPAVNRYWHELVELTLCSLEINHRTLNRAKEKSGVE